MTREPGALPAVGDIVLIGRAASVQVAGDRSLRLRITKVYDWTAYAGWCWLSGTSLGRTGRRSRSGTSGSVKGLVSARSGRPGGRRAP
jgi:hypothetical protein